MLGIIRKVGLIKIKFIVYIREVKLVNGFIYPPTLYPPIHKSKTIQFLIRKKGMIRRVTDLHKVISKEEEPPACDIILGITLIEAKDGRQ